MWVSVALDGGDPSAPTPVLHAPRAAWSERAARADAVAWTGIEGIPSDLTNGDQDTTYTVGTGLTMTGTAISASGVFGGPVVVGNGATCVAGALRHTGSAFEGCDGSTWSPLGRLYSAGAGLSLTGTTFSGAYTAGAGLSLTGTTFAVTPATGPVVVGFGTTCTAGAIRYNNGVFEGCNGSVWITLGNGSAGATVTNPAVSCKAVRDAGQSSGSGLYWITMNGGPQQVYCDMVKDGGGWMLVAAAGYVSNMTSVTSSRQPTLVVDGWRGFAGLGYTPTEMRTQAYHSTGNTRINRRTTTASNNIGPAINNFVNRTAFDYYDTGGAWTQAEDNGCSLTNSLNFIGSQAGHWILMDHISGQNNQGSYRADSNTFCNANQSQLAYGDAGSHQYIRIWLR